MCKKYESEMINKISYLEDKMLRSKNMDEVARLRSDLQALRTKLHKIQISKHKKETR